MFGDQHATSPYEAFYYYERDQLQAVRSGPWKLFVPLKEFTKHPHFKRGGRIRQKRYDTPAVQCGDGYQLQ